MWLVGFQSSVIILFVSELIWVCAWSKGEYNIFTPYPRGFRVYQRGWCVIFVFSSLILSNITLLVTPKVVPIGKISLRPDGSRVVSTVHGLAFRQSKSGVKKLSRGVIYTHAQPVKFGPVHGTDRRNNMMQIFLANDFLHHEFARFQLSRCRGRKTIWRKEVS